MPRATRSLATTCSIVCTAGATAIIVAVMVGALVCYVDAASAADESPGGAGRIIIRESGAYIDIPVPPDLYAPSKPHFYGKDRIEVPGSVAVNVVPYVCDLDKRSFEDRESFSAHLASKHGSILDGGSRPFVIRDGQVHFIGK